MTMISARSRDNFRRDLEVVEQEARALNKYPSKDVAEQIGLADQGRLWHIALTFVLEEGGCPNRKACICLLGIGAKDL